MSEDRQLPNFTDTRLAFESKSDKDLKRTRELFYMMNKQWLVNFGSKVAMWAVQLNLGFVNKIIKATIFPQFCGGVSLDDSVDDIELLSKSNALSILDYGAEAKSTAEAYDLTMKENIKAIRFAKQHDSVPAVVSKTTGLFDFNILEKRQAGEKFTPRERHIYDQSVKRLDDICRMAYENRVGLFIDAEESWIQDSIDELADLMMSRYNRDRVIVYNTFQMYRKDRLDFLKTSHEKAKSEGYLLGAKVVRGAYMVKERARAEELDYVSPIQDSKEDTDKDFNKAITYCVENYKEIASCNASHNLTSCALQSKMIADLGIERNHPHLNFCQLLGMSDNITYNLSAAGYNVAKYMVYGPVEEVVPYLVRRAQENSSVAGDVSRELHLLNSELERRAAQ